MTTIREILKGIDQQEIYSSDGWWETSVGAEFGAKKLAEVEAYHQTLLARIHRLESALEFYAKRENYGMDGEAFTSNGDTDLGNTAREALTGDTRTIGWIEINLPFGPCYGPGLTDIDSFSLRELNRPGVEIRMADGAIYLIGHINELSGICDDCTEFSGHAIVAAYRIVWAPDQGDPDVPDSTSLQT